MRSSAAITVPSLSDGLILIDSNPVPSWIYDAGTLRLVGVNALALDYFGCRREHFPVTPEAMIGGPTTASAGIAPEEIGGDILHRHRKSDGTMIAMRLKTSCIEVDGRPARLVLAIDATEEFRLADRWSARYRDLLQAVAEWEWEWDATLRISHLTPEFATSTGLLPEALLGRRLEDCADIAGKIDQWNAHRATIEARGRFRDFVVRTVGAPGQAVWLKLSGTPIIDQDGSFRGYRGVGCNVTAEIEADLALHRRERRYAGFFEVAPVWFWEEDRQHRLTFVSPNTERMLGMSLDDYRDRRLSETPGISFDPEAGKRVVAAKSMRQPYQDFLYARTRPDGTKVWISTSGTPAFDDDGAYCGYYGIARDVTSQVEAEWALAERERRYRALFETASDWFWETGTDGRLTHISPNFETLYGFPVAELLHRRFLDHPSAKIEPAMARKARDAGLARQPLRDIVYTHEFPGRVVWVKTSAVPIFDDGGVFQGYWGVSKDITGEIEAERVLRDSERQFRQVLEAAADYYWEQDAQYCYTYLSPGYEDSFGISVADSIGKRLSDITEISIDPEMGKMALRAHKTKQPYRDFIFSRKAPGGRKLWFKSSAAPFFDRNGEFEGYRGVGADVTQHVEAQAAARLAQQRLNEAVAHVSQPIVVYDAEDRVVAFNQAFTDVHRAPNANTPVYLGASFRDMAEWQMQYRFYADDADDAVVDLQALLTRHQTDAEHTYHLRDGRWMLVVYRRLPGDGSVGLWTDVTALKRAELERRALENRAHHSQRLEALGTLAGGVAHEINNALVPVIALTKIVAGKLPEESRERRNLGTALAGAERSRDLVRQILAFSRKEEDERRREKVDLGAVLHEVLQLMRATVPASIRVEEEIAPTSGVLGDPSQLQQVIVNLMNNAAQAIGEVQGRISVRLRPDEDGTKLRLTIADTGCGMDEARAARIFEPFFTTKQVGEGTGLGLSIAHGIIEAHGGRIEVTSAIDQGTRFDIILPALAP